MIVADFRYVRKCILTPQEPAPNKMLADSCVSLSTVAVIGFKITATTATTATAPPVFRALGRAGQDGDVGVDMKTCHPFG